MPRRVARTSRLCGNQHFSTMTRPSWLRRAVRNRHRHAIERASRRWRGGRRGDSARTRRKLLISTQLLARADADVHELLAYRRPSSLADSDPVRRRRGEGGERPAPAGAADGPPRLREGVHGLHAAGPMLPGGSRGNGACASSSSTLGLRPPPTHAAPALGSLHTTRDLSSLARPCSAYKRFSTVPTVLPQYQIGGGPIHSRCDCCWYLAHSDATISSETCHASGRRFLRPRGPCGFNTPKCCLGLTHLLAPQQFLPRVALDGRGPYSVRRPGARGRSGPPARADRWHEVSVGNFAKETGFAPQGVYLAVAGTAANADGGSVSSRPSCRTCPRRSGAAPT